MSMLSLIPWMIIFAFFASLRGFFLADVYCVICFSPRWLMIIDDCLLIADVIYPRITRMPAGGRGLLLMTDDWLLMTDCWLLIADVVYPRITRMSAVGRGPGNRCVQDWSCPWWMDMWGMCVFKTLVWGMVRDKTFPPVILVGCGRVGCPDN